MESCSKNLLRRAGLQLIGKMTFKHFGISIFDYKSLCWANDMQHELKDSGNHELLIRRTEYGLSFPLLRECGLFFFSWSLEQ